MKQEDFITAEVLKEQMRTRILGQNIHYVEEIDSTNVEVKRQAANGADHGLLVIAEQQTMGKGRRGRSWNSPKGTGIWMSLLLKPGQLRPENASMLTLVTALSVADAIREVTGLEAWIKWPNDIVVNGKKVCGILTEMSSEANRIHYIVIGIGINVNTKEFPEEISEIATSLLIEKGTAASRSLLAAKVMEQLEANYELFLQSGDLAYLLKPYNEKLINCNKQVKVVGSNEEITGTAKGINEKGELLVQIEDRLLEVCSGEVSVRGLYGYV